MDNIPSWTSEEERVCLHQLASEVPDNGRIVEIGCLYGGTTYELATGNPKANVITIDDFSWTPDGYPKATAELADKNLKDHGVGNVFILVGKSSEIVRNWKGNIDLCFIDGGHSFQYCYADLVAFSKFSRVVAMHDYGNEFWPDIKQAVDKFLALNPLWHLDNVVGMVVTLRRLE